MSVYTQFFLYSC